MVTCYIFYYPKNSKGRCILSQPDLASAKKKVDELYKNECTEVCISESGANTQSIIKMVYKVMYTKDSKRNCLSFFTFSDHNPYNDIYQTMEQMEVNKFTIYPMKYEDWYFLGLRISRDMRNYLDEVRHNNKWETDKNDPPIIKPCFRRTKYQYVHKFNHVWKKSKLAKELRKRKTI